MGHKINFDSMDWINQVVGARSKTFNCDSRKVRILEFTEGFYEEDWCRNGHLGIVLEGETDLDFDGQVEHYVKGDIFYIPEGEGHKHKAIIKDNSFVRLLLVE